MYQNENLMAMLEIMTSDDVAPILIGGFLIGAH